MLYLQDISYIHPNKDLLFENINLAVNNHEKIALVGKNGSGKSTLLRIVNGELIPAGGRIEKPNSIYYIPQIFGQYNHLTVAQALKVDHKIHALTKILKGQYSEENYTHLQDDWTIESRCQEALNHWKLGFTDLSQKMGSLSGGQKTKVLLACINIHQPRLILMDEPSNHLDLESRKQLYHFIEMSPATMVIVSHDRKLLNLLDTICELHQTGLTTYGGNYAFYQQQKILEQSALEQDIQGKEKLLREARNKQRETLERQQKQQARGRKKQAKSGMPKVMMDKMKNDSENRFSKLKHAHAGKVDGIHQDLKALRAALPDPDKMRFDFDPSDLHQGKILFQAYKINYQYASEWVWKSSLSMQIKSGERIALKGANGSGKTTLIKVVLGNLIPQVGTFKSNTNKALYIDQDYSLIDNRLSVCEQANQYNSLGLPDHEVKTRLNRFLFGKESWDKPCQALSGGERMRLMLCCLNIGQQAPDLIILDEPTNNLDIQNIEILTNAINSYKGTLIVVSHDEDFIEDVRIERTIELTY
ncbi:MAG: ABC-F family ATP-binding cassette domain-containing protein [Cyclobacteriaceae bacterium]|nr:ABC-F family ATP-binding cassette domain-containing protein [Cyclobacteriaceae bacterium SS2]